MSLWKSTAKSELWRTEPNSVLHNSLLEPNRRDYRVALCFTTSSYGGG
ncbi:hypothetical protein AVEN_35893-1, partial [Araneus ventricosus]